MRRLIADEGSYFAGRAFPAAMQLGLVILLARVLGPEKYGVYSLIGVGTFVFADVASKWNQQAVLRFLPIVGSRAAAAILVKGLALQVTFGMAVALVLALILTPAIGDGPLLFIAAALTMCTMAFNTLRAVFQGNRHAVRWSTYSVVNAALRVTLTCVVLVTHGSDIHWLLSASIVAYGVLIPFMLRGSGLRRSDLRLQHRGDVLTWWRFGWPLSLSAAALQVLGYADRFILAIMRGSAAAGLYSSVYDLLNRGVYPIVDAIILSTQPRVMHAHREIHQMSFLVRQASLRILVLLGPVLGVSTVGGERLTRLAFGSNYRATPWLLPILVAAFSFWHVGTCIQAIPEALGRSRAVLSGAGGAAVIGTAACIGLIPIWGVDGAAVATAIGYAAYFLVLQTVTRRLVGWRFPLRRALPVALAVVVASGAGFFAARELPDTTPMLIVAVIVTVAVYVSTLVAGGKPLLRNLVVFEHPDANLTGGHRREAR